MSHIEVSELNEYFTNLGRFAGLYSTNLRFILKIIVGDVIPLIIFKLNHDSKLKIVLAWDIPQIFLLLEHFFIKK